MKRKELLNYMDKLEEGYNIKSAKNMVYTIILIGAMMNFIAMINNQGMMPVKSDFYLSDETHFSYVFDFEVQYSLLTDRYRLDLNSSNYFYYSLGDILLVLGGLLFVGMTVWDSINSYQLIKIKKGLIKEALK